MQSLYTAFSKIKTEKEFNAFLVDLLTPKEIREVNARWKIAQLLWNVHRERVRGLGGENAKIKGMAKSRVGLTQQDIANQTGIALATITRVSKCLFENKDNGYRSILSAK